MEKNEMTFFRVLRNEFFKILTRYYLMRKEAES